MASGPPEHHVDRLGHRLAHRSCNFVLAAEKRLGGLGLIYRQLAYICRVIEMVGALPALPMTTPYNIKIIPDEADISVLDYKGLWTHRSQNYGVVANRSLAGH